MEYVFENYARWDLEIVSGKGTAVHDQNGKKYLDFSSGIGVCNLGHCNEKVVSAVSSQLNKLWHISNLFTSTFQDDTAHKLASGAGDYKVLFCNSGAEANEAAIKLARKHTGKHKIFTFNQSFHGRTLGTLAATGQDKVKVGFGPLVETFIHVPFNDLNSLEEQIDHDTAAVMLEVIQGEGGVHVASTSFLSGVEQLCREHGALLIIDEVQTGIGRTGNTFAFQEYGINPDIVTSAKGLGNGFPVGAMLGKTELATSFGPGSHGTTFGGNPLAMSAANAVLTEVFQEQFLSEVKQKGDYFMEKLAEVLKDIEGFVEIRGKGLMIGIEFSTDVSKILSILREKGLIVLNAGPNVVRLLPPLTVTIDEIDQALSLFHDVVNEVALTR